MSMKLPKQKSLLLAGALFLGLVILVAPPVGRSILAYPTSGIQQVGYSDGQKPGIKEPTVRGISTSSTNSSTSTNAQEKSSNNVMQLNAQEKKGVYTWSNKHGTNPVLTFKLDTNNVVHIKNPTDTKHDLIITSSGSQVATSGDVKPGATGQLSFSPTTSTGTFQYHCLYHPTTMKGTIKISP